MKYLSPGSYWIRTDADSAEYPALQRDGRYDVVVIGAGITGLTTALHLKRAGKRVAVLESGAVGAGTTGGTSAHLDIAPDQGFRQLVQDFGEETARQVTDCRRAAIDQIERWTRELDIDCDFRRLPAYLFTESADGKSQLEAEFEEARRLGVDVEMLPAAGLPFPTAAAARFSGQARFHAIRYVRALAQAVHGDGSAIHQNTKAETPKSGRPCKVQANGHEVEADVVVVATHSAYLGISQFDLRQAPYQSYMLAVRVEDEVADALYWDDQQPYHYLRVASSSDPHLLLVGGADHKTGQADEQERMHRLEEYVVRRFKQPRIEQAWSSEYFEPSDGLPFIGRVPMADNQYLATGFSGTGLTYGTAAGDIISSQILERESPYAELFSPSRVKPLAAAADFVSENMNAAKHFVTDRFQVEHLESFDVISAGEGRIVEVDGEKLAVYRDENNQLHQLSPVCTHAGCFVQWNGEEKSWDCPCHGGRFSPTGERLYGPPASDLKQKQTEASRSH